VKEELDGDAASALMALATNSEIKSGDEDSVQKEEEAAEVPNQPSAVLRTSVESEPLESNTIATRPQASMKFPSKLMHALNCPTNAHIITWSPDGKSFIFIDRKAFEATILPVAFKDSKFASFLRKLYRWGFSKCQAHSKAGVPAYKHELFHRDFPEHVKAIECRSKGRSRIPGMMMEQNAMHGGPYFPQALMNQSMQSMPQIMNSGMQHGSDHHSPYMNPFPQRPDMYDGGAAHGNSASLSNYISERREQHQRVMNYAASHINSSQPNRIPQNPNMPMTPFAPMGMYPMNYMANGAMGGMYMPMNNGYMMNRDGPHQGMQAEATAPGNDAQKQQNEETEVGQV